MNNIFSGRSLPLVSIKVVVAASLMIFAGAIYGEAKIVPPVNLVPLSQIPVPEPQNLYEFIKHKNVAIMLGKAFYWDMQVGSDGKTACATCHFHAGSDNRTKNMVNPGTRTPADVSNLPFWSGPSGFETVSGPNQTWDASEKGEFPFHLRAAPSLFQSSAVIRDSNDIAGSQGIRLAKFEGLNLDSAAEKWSPLPDPLFRVNGVNVRQVTDRNVPTVINAIFNFTQFWDGRASPFFNGVNPFGPLDQSAGIYFNRAGSLAKEQIEIDFGSLASQATGPPLSEVEMSYRGRTWADIAKKMLHKDFRPLGKQLVHPEDGDLGFMSRAVLLSNGAVAGEKGLTYSYETLIKYAFQDNLWNSTQTTPEGLSQIEANFTLFWGLAIQLYEATLVADNTPFDRFLGGDGTALTPDQELGFNLFFGGAGKCDLCHGGTELTMASVTANAWVNNATHAIIDLMNVASGKQIIYDNGFNNTAVRDTNEDIARGGYSPFVNPLVPADPLVPAANLIPLSFSAMAELQAKQQLAFSVPILPGNVPASFPIANDGAFKVPTLRNVELTAPYMHNGGIMTIDDVVDIYARGGDFHLQNKNDRDINIQEIPDLQQDHLAHLALSKFMLSFTDERVRNYETPFDHPELYVPNGTSDNDMDMIHLPATGVFGINALPPTDADNDRIHDSWEMSYFGNLTTAGWYFGKYTDYDEDGYSDYIEFRLTTLLDPSPKDPRGTPFHPLIKNAPGGIGWVKPVDIGKVHLMINSLLLE